jgi:hypothetical protein
MFPVDPVRRREPDESNRCAFCDFRGKLTLEHVWPRRFDEEVTVTGLARHERGDMTSMELESWRAGVFTARVRIDCDTCNNVKLETIEREAWPFVASMAFAEGAGVLSLTAQRMVAAFALRMFAVAQYTHPQARPIPRHHREYLVTQGSAPPRTEVWLWTCAFAGEALNPDINAASMPVARKGEALGGMANGYRGILRIGRLIIEIASRTDGMSFPMLPGRVRTYLRVWPITDLKRVIVWPPEQALTEAEWVARYRGINQPVTL